MDEIQTQINRIWQGWNVDRVIGEGSFGTVYEISKSEYGHVYKSALKVINVPQKEAEIKAILNDGASVQEAQKYFETIVENIVAEVVLMSKLKGYSHIVSYEDHQVVSQKESIGFTIFIRMELLTPLVESWKNRDIRLSDIIRMGIDICKALETCQQYSIIHRDIKPENIFVNNKGIYKLGDFGVAKKLELSSYEMSKKGTYSYMAPEIYRGGDYDSLVDIYSLGIVLYRYLNYNRIPFLPAFPEPITYNSREQAILRRMKGEIIPAPLNCDKYISDIILKSCEYDGKNRYQSAKEMRIALEKALQYIKSDSLPLAQFKTEEEFSEKTVLLLEEKNDITKVSTKNNKIIKYRYIIFFEILIGIIALLFTINIIIKPLSISSEKTFFNINKMKGDSDWARIQKSGVMTVGITTDTAYKIEVIRAVCDELGVEAEIKEIDFEDRFEAIKRGEIDCSLNGKGYDENIETSKGIYRWPIKAVIKKDNKHFITNGNIIDSLIGKTFAFRTLSKAESAFDSVEEWGNNKTIRTLSTKETINMILNDQVDVGLFLNNINFSQYDNIYVIPDFSVDYTIVFNAPKDSDLIEHINEAIKKLKNNKTFEKIEEENDLFD